MLEPRRLAARASAARMASLLGEQVGETVGVTTRDDRRGESVQTRIEVVTEGILTRRLQRDPELEGCGLVIFDEFHERSQQADLGLALLLDAQRALDLRTAVMVMSATIDAPKVAALIGEPDPAPVIECGGRTFDVEMHWRPRNQRDRLEPAGAYRRSSGHSTQKTMAMCWCSCRVWPKSVARTNCCGAWTRASRYCPVARQPSARRAGSSGLRPDAQGCERSCSAPTSPRAA